MGRFSEGYYIDARDLGQAIRRGDKYIRLDPDWDEGTVITCGSLLKDDDPPFPLPEGVDCVYLGEGGTYVLKRKGMIWDRFNCLEKIRGPYTYSPYTGFKHKARKAEEARRKKEEAERKRMQEEEEKRLDELGNARMNEIKRKLALMSEEDFEQFLESNF